MKKLFKSNRTRAAMMTTFFIMVNMVMLHAQSVLVYGPLLSAAPNEATIAATIPGCVVTVVLTDADWLLMNTVQFASYDAIIIPDDGCNSSGFENNSTALQTLYNSRAAWSPAVKGRFYAIGTDPLYHRLSTYQTLIKNAIKWVSSGNCTGLYYCTSCNFVNTSPPIGVNFLSDVTGLAGLKIEGQNAIGGDDENITIQQPAHPSMTTPYGTITNASLSNWNQSVHGFFVNLPTNVYSIANGGTLPYIIGCDFLDICCGVNIDDGNACTIDGCDPVTGVYHIPIDCDDGDLCTLDACDPAVGCVHFPVTIPDDGNGLCSDDHCNPATGTFYYTAVDCNDFNHCTIDYCDPITGCHHTPVRIYPNAFATNGTTCGGLGAITFEPTGGSAPYDVQLYSGSNQIADFPNQGYMSYTTVVPAGTYSLLVIDQYGCNEIVFITVTTIPLPEVHFTLIQPTCANPCSGHITAWATGGTPYDITIPRIPYDISITQLSGSSPTRFNSEGELANFFEYADNLCIGVYQITVTDANGCTATTTVVINPPANCDCGNCFHPGPELINNGDFTAGNTGFTSGLTPSCTCLRGSYCVTNIATSKCNSVNWFPVGGNPGPLGSAGNYLVVDGHHSTSNKVIWRQVNIPVTMGVTYVFKFWIHPNVSNAPVRPTFQITGLNGIPIVVPMNYPADNGHWSLKSFTWMATATGVRTISIIQTNNDGGGFPDGCDYGIDDISFRCCLPDITVNAGNDITICKGDCRTLTAVATLSIPISLPVTYDWKPGIHPPLASILVCPIATTYYTVTARDGKGCIATDIVKVTVKNVPAAPSSISGPRYCLCGTTATFCIPAMPGTTGCTWIVPTGATIISGQNTTCIMVSFSGNFTSGVIKVACRNECGLGAFRSITVYGKPAPPTINGADVICLSQLSSFYHYFYNQVGCPITEYIWSVTNGFCPNCITTNHDNVDIMWNSPTASTHKICLTVKNQCGSSDVVCKSITITPLCRVTDSDLSSGSLQAYPNPANAELNVLFSCSADDHYALQLQDVTGRTVMNETGNGDDNGLHKVIDVHSFAKGMYLIQLKTAEGTSQMKVMVE